MQAKETHSRNLRSFLNGFLTPVIGWKGIDRQIRHMEASPGRGHLLYFSLGHAIAVYPCIVSLGFGLYRVVDNFHLY